MLLRRISQHVKDQNWFAVLLDFFIVVVGVFVGIQVANWNEERITKQNSLKARADLIADLRNDLDVFAVRQKFYLEVRDASIKTLGILTGDFPASVEAQWQFFRDAQFAGAAWPFKPSGQVYDQLLNAGKLGLISEPAVLRQMRDYYQDAANEIGVTFKFDSNYRYQSRRLLSWPILNYQTVACSSQIANSDPSEVIGDQDTYYQPCATPESLELRASITETAMRIHGSEELIADLRLQLSQLNTLIALIEYLTVEAKSLIAELENS